jgi:hypothetical protein
VNDPTFADWEWRGFSLRFHHRDNLLPVPYIETPSGRVMEPVGPYDSIDCECNYLAFRFREDSTDLLCSSRANDVFAGEAARVADVMTSPDVRSEVWRVFP